MMALQDIISFITNTTKHFKAKCRDQFRSSVKFAPESPRADQVQMQQKLMDQYRDNIQRANSLILQEMHAGAKLFHYERLVDDGCPPDPFISQKLHECDMELKQLNIKYFEHLEKSSELVYCKQPGRRDIRYTKGLHHRPNYFWSFEEVYCELQCGCGSTDCRCCSRSMEMTLDTWGRIRWMHCTGSCGCCIWHQDAESVNSMIENYSETEARFFFC